MCRSRPYGRERRRRHRSPLLALLLALLWLSRQHLASAGRLQGEPNLAATLKSAGGDTAGASGGAPAPADGSPKQPAPVQPLRGAQLAQEASKVAWWAARSRTTSTARCWVLFNLPAST